MIAPAACGLAACQAASGQPWRDDAACALPHGHARGLTARYFLRRRRPAARGGSPPYRARYACAWTFRSVLCEVM